MKSGFTWQSGTGVRVTFAQRVAEDLPPKSKILIIFFFNHIFKRQTESDGIVTVNHFMKV